MPLALFLTIVVVLFLAYLWVVERIRAHATKVREKRANCTHPSWRWGHAFDDPRWPIRTCEKCGLQQHLETPILCQHCGEDIRMSVDGEPTVKHET